MLASNRWINIYGQRIYVMGITPFLSSVENNIVK